MLDNNSSVEYTKYEERKYMSKLINFLCAKCKVKVRKAWVKEKEQQKLNRSGKNKIGKIKRIQF